LTSSHLNRPKIDPIALPLLLSPAKDLLSRHRCLPHPAADFILKPPLSKLSHHLSLHRRATSSAFLLALTLPSSSPCFRHCAAARFIDTPPLPSLLRRQFCLCRRAAAAFFVTPPFPSLSRRQFCLRHRAAAAFVIAPPPVLHLSSRHRCHPCRAAAAFVIALPLASLSRRRSLHRCAAGSAFVIAPSRLSSSRRRF
jgi:hypothetical protein